MSPPKYVDLLALLIALAVFLIGDLPLLGYAVAAAVWLLQRGIQMLAQRRMKQELGRRQPAEGDGDRRRQHPRPRLADGHRVLLVGIAERESGLASAILLLALFTISFAAQGLAHLFEQPEGQGA